MLDGRIVELARRTAGPQLKDLDQPLALRAGANRAKLHGYGHLYLVLMDLYKEEVARRAEIIWRNLHRAHNSLGALYTVSLRADLLEAFRIDLDSALQELRPRFDKDMKDAPKMTKEPDWEAKFGAARDHELARYDAEIEHYVNSVEVARARGEMSPPRYVIQGNIGAVLTGPGAVAHVIQNIGSAQREELGKALETVKAAINQAPELVERDRRELNEIADAAGAEIAKEQPNSRSLNQALHALAATVQGIANGSAAYEVLRTAAAAIGIAV